MDVVRLRALIVAVCMAAIFGMACESEEVTSLTGPSGGGGGGGGGGSSRSGGQRYGPYSECRNWPDTNVRLTWCRAAQQQIQVGAHALGAHSDACAAAASSAEGNNQNAETYLSQAAQRCDILSQLVRQLGAGQLGAIPIVCDCDDAEWWSDARRFR